MGFIVIVPALLMRMSIPPSSSKTFRLDVRHGLWSVTSSCMRTELASEPAVVAATPSPLRSVRQTVAPSPTNAVEIALPDALRGPCDENALVVETVQPVFLLSLRGS